VNHLLRQPACPDLDAAERGTTDLDLDAVAAASRAAARSEDHLTFPRFRLAHY